MLEAHWLGTVEYTETWEKQKSWRTQVSLGGPQIVLGCEHLPVITGGKRITKDLSLFDKHSMPFVATDRGGLATFHNPGQLVVYPIFSLRKYDLGAREWVNLLLDSTVESLKKCNIILVEKNNGIFTKNGKIASIGININKGISTHGVAINVRNDLAVSNKLESCGIQNQKMDKVVNYAPEVSPESLFKLWVDSFKERLTLLD